MSEIPGPTIKGFLHGAFLENWGPKLISLALVSMAWLALASPQEVKINVVAPIRYVNLPSELTLSEDSAKTVRLTLSGRRHSIRVLEDNEVRVQVGLGNRVAGTHLIKLSVKNVDLPLGVNINRATPQNIKAILISTVGEGTTREKSK